MASTWSSGGIDYVAASVSEFTAVIGYCEYEAPMVLQKIKTTPSKAVMAGLQAHEEEEEYEKEHVVLEEVTPEQVADPIQNIEFPREYIMKRIEYKLRALVAALKRDQKGRITKKRLAKWIQVASFFGQLYPSIFSIRI